jgi:hypothetical protein
MRTKNAPAIAPNSVREAISPQDEPAKHNAEIFQRQTACRTGRPRRQPTGASAWQTDASEVPDKVIIDQ